MSVNKVHNTAKEHLNSMILTNHGYTSSFATVWESLSDHDRDFLIELVVRARNNIIIKYFDKRLDIALKYLGTFKIKRERKVAMAAKRKALASRGVINCNDMSLSEYMEVKKEMIKAVVDDGIEHRKSRDDSRDRTRIGIVHIAGSKRGLL